MCNTMKKETLDFGYKELIHPRKKVNVPKSIEW